MNPFEWLRRLFRRRPRPPVTYAPRYLPGEIVWGFVRFEERPGGKDRPVLVAGYAAPGLLRVHALSSQAKHATHPDWYLIGSGGWDRMQRSSWVHLTPVNMLESNVRRRAGALDADRLREIQRALRH